MLRQRDEPGHLVPQEDEFEFREPGRDVLAALGPDVEGVEADAHVVVVVAALEFDGGDVVAQQRHSGSGSVGGRLIASVVGSEGVREPFLQLFVFLLERLGAGVGVEQVAVGDLELGVAFVEAPPGVDDVLHAFELVFRDVGAREADEVVDEEVVDVREGLDGRAGGVGGEGHAGFEDVVRGWGAVV